MASKYEKTSMICITVVLCKLYCYNSDMITVLQLLTDDYWNDLLCIKLHQLYMYNTLLNYIQRTIISLLSGQGLSGICPSPGIIFLFILASEYHVLLT